jgi:membrane dipeptidase
MLGISFYARHLRRSGSASLDDVIRHTLHLARAAGGAEHVGLGTDLDGGFGAEDAALSNLSELKALRASLRRHFNVTQVEGILGTNWLEFLSRSLPA